MNRPASLRNNSPLMTVAQVAEQLKLSEAWVYARIAEGSMPHFKLKGAVRISEEHLEEFLKRHENGGEPKKAPRHVKLKHLS